jgi:hypothetical protein
MENKVRAKVKKPRTCYVTVQQRKAKVGMYWWPVPFDKKRRQIPSSVDVWYNIEYHSRQESISMLLIL